MSIRESGEDSKNELCVFDCTKKEMKAISGVLGDLAKKKTVPEDKYGGEFDVITLNVGTKTITFFSVHEAKKRKGA